MKPKQLITEDQIGTMQQQLDRIESMLTQLLSQSPTNRNGWPIHAPTIEDEIAAVEARGGSLLQHIREKNKQKKIEEKRKR